MWNSKGLFTNLNTESLELTESLTNLFHENQDMFLGLEDEMSSSSDLSSEHTKKRKHGNIWKSSSVIKQNESFRQKKLNTNYANINASATTTSKKNSNIKTEPLEDKHISSIQHQLFSMTEKDHMAVVKAIHSKFPKASCHELCCRLCRYYQTNDLQETFNWMYDPSTAEYSPDQLTASAVFIKKENDREQAYQVVQDKAVAPYNSSHFTFAEGSTFFIENEKSALLERELILLDSNSYTARQSCNFSEFYVKMELGKAFQTSNTTKIVYGTIYLYFSAPTPLEAVSSGSHTIVFFGKLNADFKESNTLLFIDPQEKVISKKIEDLVKFSSRPSRKAKGDIFGDEIFWLFDISCGIR